VRLGLLAAARLVVTMRRHPEAGIYMQISQGRWGFLRDALWIWLGRAFRRPVYLHVLGGRFDNFYYESGALMRRFIRVTMRQAEAHWILTPSLSTDLDPVARSEQVQALSMVVADPADEGAVAADRNGGPVRILFLSNLREGKGHWELLAALAALGERARGWQVRLVGECEDETRAELREWIGRNLGGAVNIEITGVRMGDAKADEFIWADVFAFPTRYRNEAQPLVVLEAMAWQRAIVTTRHRGIPDTVRDDREALLVDPGDVDGLAIALERVAADPQLRARLGDAARARYEERYTPERLDQDLAALLGATRPRS